MPRPDDTRLTPALGNKVPEITAAFWIIKVLSTTVGETGADYLSVQVGWGQTITTALTLTLFGFVLQAQLRARHHVPWLYWSAVVLVSVVGTQLTDALTDGLGVSLFDSTPVFAALLTMLFAIWFRLEGTLDINHIDTLRRECLYWGAVLCTFALGTAAGDLATEALALGFVRGTLAFGVLFALAMAAWRAGAPWLACFWVAYVVTRPFGAAVGDWLSQSHEYGGLGFGAERTSLVFLSAIVVLVAVQQMAQRPALSASRE